MARRPPGKESLVNLHHLRRSRAAWIPAAGLAALALAAAGCGSSSGSSGGSGSKSAIAPAPASSGSRASVALGATKLGKVLVDGRGRTLYRFAADKANASM